MPDHSLTRPEPPRQSILGRLLNMATGGVSGEITGSNQAYRDYMGDRRLYDASRLEAQQQDALAKRMESQRLAKLREDMIADHLDAGGEQMNVDNWGDADIRNSTRAMKAKLTQDELTRRMLEREMTNAAALGYGWNPDLTPAENRAKLAEFQTTQRNAPRLQHIQDVRAKLAADRGLGGGFSSLRSPATEYPTEEEFAETARQKRVVEIEEKRLEKEAGVLLEERMAKARALGTAAGSPEKKPLDELDSLKRNELFREYFDETPVLVNGRLSNADMKRLGDERERRRRAQNDAWWTRLKAAVGEDKPGGTKPPGAKGQQPTPVVEWERGQDGKLRRVR